MKTTLVLLISAALSGCGGFVYNSPGHPSPITLYRVERTLPVIGFVCDKKAANCQPAYTPPTGMRIGPDSVTPEQVEAGVLGFWCNERAANCRPLYPLPAVTQTVTTGVIMFQSYEQPYYGYMPNRSDSWCCTRQDKKWWRY